MTLPRIVVSPFLCVYFTTAALTWLVPLIIMGSARRQLARQQDDDDNNNNQDDQQQQEYYNKCRWWQWGCNSQYYADDANDNQDQNNNNDRDVYTPWWWFFASEEDQRKRDESQSNNPAMVLVYIWSLVLFTALVWFGYRQLRSFGNDLRGVSIALVVFANASLMSLFLIGGLEGGVQTDGPELEEQGFYGQFGVMMVLTNLLYFVFAAVYAVVFWLRARRKEVTCIDIDESDYKMHDEPPVTA